MAQTIIDPLCLEAFERLLARPDPKDLPRRAHVLRWEGELHRRSTRLMPIMRAWLQWHFLEIDGEVARPAADLRRASHWNIGGVGA